MTAPTDKPVAQTPTQTVPWDGVCWVLGNPDGTVYEDDRGYPEPHLHTEEEIRKLIADVGEDPAGQCVPLRLTAPCVEIACSECGYVYDEDDEGIGHWESRDEAVKALKGDWLFGDGAAYCPNEDCVEAARALVVEEIPNQTAITIPAES